MRRKLITVIVITLLVALPATPAVLGWHTEEIYRDVAARVSDDNPEIDLRIHEYERGWLGARAQYTVDITGPWAELYREHADTDEPLQMHGRDDIRHGPWLGEGFGAARFDSELRMADALHALGHDEIADNPILVARSHINTRGHVDSRFHIPDYRFAFDAATDDGAPRTLTLEWRDAGGRAGIEGDLSRVLLLAPELTLSDDEGTHVAVRDFELGDRSRRGSDGLWLGRAHMAIAELEVALEEAGEALGMELNGLTIETRSEADDDRAEVTSLFAFDDMSVNGNRFEDGEFRTRIRNLEREPLARLNHLINRAQQEFGQDEIDPAYEAEMMEAVDDLLRGSPELQSERIHIGTDEGPITGDLRLGFDGERPFQSELPITLLDPLSGHLELRVPRPLVRDALYAAMQGHLPEGEFGGEMEARLRQQVDQSINILVAMGLLEREGSEIILRVQKETGGPPLVNDQDVMAMFQALSQLFE